MTPRNWTGPNVAGNPNIDTADIAYQTANEALAVANAATGSNAPDLTARSTANSAYSIAVAGTNAAGSALNAAIIAQGFATTAWQVGTYAGSSAQAAALVANSAYAAGTNAELSAQAVATVANDAYTQGTNANARVGDFVTYGTYSGTATIYGTNLASGALELNEIVFYRGLCQNWTVTTVV